MSTIQELESRLEQHKAMLSRMQSDIASIEVELNQIKSGQVQETAKVQQAQPQQMVQQEPQPAMQYNDDIKQPVQQQVVQPQMQQPQMQQPQMQQINPAAVQPQPTAQNQNPYMPQQGGQFYNQNQKFDWNAYYAQKRAEKSQGYQNPAQSQQLSKPLIDKKASAESILGKNIMGIAASVLIFISLILFAMLIVPNLTEVFKVVLMYALSIALTTFGLVMWFRKNQESPFFLSLGACGVGSLYISLLLTHAYFHMIDKIALYILFLFWVGGVLLLSNYKQRVFESIGNSGIFVSVVFGVLQCMKDEDSGLMIVLIIYFLIGTLAFTITKLKDKTSLAINSFFSMPSVIMFLIGAGDLGEHFKYDNLGSHTDMYFMMGLVAVFCFGMCLLTLYKNKESNVMHLIISMAFSMLHLIAVNVMMMCDSDDARLITSLIMIVIYYVIIEVYARRFRQKENAQNIPLYIWRSLLLILAMIDIFQVNDLSDYVGLFILICPLIIYGFIIDDTFSKYAALVMYGILIFCVSMEPVALFMYVIIVFAMYILFMYIYKNQYDTKLKAISYMIFMIGLSIAIAFLSFEYEWDADVVMPVMIFLLGGINLAVLKTPFGKHWLTTDDEKLTTAICYIENALVMVFAMIAIYLVSDSVSHFFVAIGMIGVFMINSYSLLKTKNAAKSIYVGVKFTILVIVILNSYDAPNYVMSVVAFLLSIAFIIIGFVMDIKSLRIYGLVISMICVFKLVMIDITYENTAGHALSFFISGVLCFVISALYNIADKRMRRVENEEITAQ